MIKLSKSNVMLNISSFIGTVMILVIVGMIANLSTTMMSVMVFVFSIMIYSLLFMEIKRIIKKYS